MENSRSGQNLNIVLAGVWLLITTSLIVWWMYFALSLIAQMQTDVARHRAMLLWEGATLLVLLLAGGCTLIYFILQEKRRVDATKKLFSAFTHDMKTRLAGIKLQGESLTADLNDPSLKPLTERLLTDVSRLQVQVENSLFVGGADSAKIYVESVNLKNILDILRDSWPQLKINLVGDALVQVDKRLFENIVTNLLHNALTRGKAAAVTVTAKSVDGETVKISFQDDGQGFSGDHSLLGKVFYRHSHMSGSGLGLYTINESLKKMSGEVAYVPTTRGFCVELTVPGATA